MSDEEEKEIPESGAVYTIGKCQISDKALNHFYIRGDPIIDIACGDEHTVILCGSGRAFSFGCNDWGQLGLGHFSMVKKPTCINSLKPMEPLQVVCGRSHTLIVTVSGLVYSFGNNSDGQLGIGGTDNTAVPKLIDSINNVSHLGAGCCHSVALTDDGKVFVWGSNSDGQLGLGKHFIGTDTPHPLELDHHILKIACGYYHTVLITDEGRLIVFGEGESGKLGLGDTLGKDIPTYIPSHYQFIDVSAGGHHTVAITDEMQVLGWGSNELGQIGLGDDLFTLTPTVIPTLASTTIKMISCGQNHSAFLTDEGRLLICGETKHGKLGLDTGSKAICQKEPIEVPKFSNHHVYKVRCGGCHTEVLAMPLNCNDDSLVEESLPGQIIQEFTPSSQFSGKSLPSFHKVSPCGSCVDPVLSMCLSFPKCSHRTKSASTEPEYLNQSSDNFPWVNDKENMLSLKRSPNHQIEDNVSDILSDCEQISTHLVQEVSYIDNSFNHKLVNGYASLDGLYNQIGQKVKDTKRTGDSEWSFCATGEFEQAFNLYKNRKHYQSLPDVRLLTQDKYNLVQRLRPREIKQHDQFNDNETAKINHCLNVDDCTELKRTSGHFNLIDSSSCSTKSEYCETIACCSTEILDSSENTRSMNSVEDNQFLESWYNVNEISKWVQECNQGRNTEEICKSKVHKSTRHYRCDEWDLLTENDSFCYNQYLRIRKCIKNTRMTEMSVNNKCCVLRCNNFDLKNPQQELKRRMNRNYVKEQGNGETGERRIYASSNNMNLCKRSAYNGMVEENKSDQGYSERKYGPFCGVKPSTSQLTQTEISGHSIKQNGFLQNEELEKKSKMCVII